MEEGKGIYFKNFGAFHIKQILGQPKKLHCRDVQDYTSESYDVEVIPYNYKAHPIFTPAGDFLHSLPEYMFQKGIDQRVRNTNFLKGKHNTIFFNPAPLANACYFQKKLVESSVRVIFQACGQLAFKGKALNLNFGCCSVKVKAKSIEKISFDKAFVKKLNDDHTLQQRKDDVTSTYWRPQSKYGRMKQQ